MKVGTRYISVLMLLVSLAFTVGMFTASPAAATTIYLTMTVNRGPEAGTNTMTCGWHGTCTSPQTPGAGLDWSQTNNTGVWLRSWTNSTYGYHTAATGLASRNDSASCYSVQVKVKDTPGAVKGHIYYTHTDSAIGGSFDISAGPVLSPANTVREVGDTVYPDKVGCKITGGHLHQYAGSGFTTNSGRYAVAPATETGVVTNALANSQANISFNYWQ